jgi:RNA polymerase sigma-70 factor (ECF subfamily)
MDEDQTLRSAAQSMRAGAPLPPEMHARLNAIFASYHPRLSRMVGGWTRDPGRTEDVVQEALMAGWRQLPEFRFESSFLHYLGSIARNLVRRNARKMSELLTEDGDVDPASEEMTALAQLRDEEQLAVLQAAVADLPQLEQDALHLRYELGLSQDDVTAQLGLEHASGGRGTLQQARRHLRARLRSALVNLGHGSSFFESSEG